MSRQPEDHVQPGDHGTPARPRRNGLLGSILDGVDIVKDLTDAKVVRVLLFVFLLIFCVGIWIGYGRIIADMEYNRQVVKDEVSYSRQYQKEHASALSTTAGEVRSLRHTLDIMRGEMQSLRDEVRQLLRLRDWWGGQPKAKPKQTIPDPCGGASFLPDWWTTTR